MTALFLALVSAASAYDVQLCGQYTPTFTESLAPDNDGLDANGDGDVANDKQDFMTTASLQPLRGIHMAAERQEADGSWTTMWSGWSPVTGPDAGCTGTFATTAGAPPSALHVVRLRAWTLSSAAGHYISVFDDDDTKDLGEISSGAVFVASDGRRDLDMGTGDDRFDLALLAAFALNREDGDNDPLTLTIYDCPRPNDGDLNCLGPNASGSWWNHEDQELYVGSNDLRVALHELGHGVAKNQMPNQSDPWDITYSWNNDRQDPLVDSACPVNGDVSHRNDSDEATSAAITEAYANYYAAVILNRTDEADCFLYMGTLDWDNDEVDEPDGWVSCEQRPVMRDAFDVLMPTTMNKDWWAHECDQGVNSVASEYDWLRGLWDLDTDHGYTFASLVQVLAEAHPDTWIRDPDPLVFLLPLLPPTPRCPEGFANADLACPYFRMARDSNNSIRANWLNACDNGICR